MARLRPPAHRRSAAALIETAAVLVIFLMLLFGVFEYCRLLFVKQLVDNAAREGARFAIVNTTDANLIADTQAVVNARMAGMQGAVNNWQVQVYHADSNGNPVYGYQSDSNGPYVQNSQGAKTYFAYDSSSSQYYITQGSSQIYFTLNTSSSTVNDTSGQFANWASQNQIGNIDAPMNAAFGQYIAVQIDCDYNPIVPSLLLMNQTIHIQTRALMYSEAN
jgi:Flp pilus assembly protein TadG